MSTASDLTALGWRTNTDARYRQAIRDFQAMWNLGPALSIDGNDGPATRAALAVSMARRAKGLPDISANFSAIEFQCNCGDSGRTIATDCRRIWTPRSTVQMAEKFRTLVGPFTPERACRCPRENARVGGAKSSQHLSGRGLDVPIYDVTVAQVRKATGCDGIGTYGGNGRLYVRHIDNRGSWAQWSYGSLKTTPIAPRPDLARTAPKPPAPTPKPVPITPSPSKEDDMPSAQEIAAAVWNHQLSKPGNSSKQSAGAQLGNAHIFAYRNNALANAQSPAKIAEAVKAALAAAPAAPDVDTDELARKIVVELGRDKDEEPAG